jgi:hypothetical protein
MNEYASDVANSIIFFVGGEWVDASSGAPIDVISPSTEHGPTEHGIAGLGRARSWRHSAGGMSKVAGCAVQRVMVAAHGPEYFVGYLNPSAPRRGEGVRLRGRFGRTKWFIAPMSRSNSVQVSQR